MRWLSERVRVWNNRLGLLAGFYVVLFFVLIARLYFLQIIEAEKYQILSDKNRISFQVLSSSRGSIYDRNGVPLAVNQRSFYSYIIPEQAKGGVEKTLEKYARLVPLSETEKERVLKEVERERSFVPIEIQENLSFDDMAKLQLNLPDLSGIFIEEGLSRFYPQGEALAHPLGYVSVVSADDLKDSDPLLTVPHFRLGKAGIEQYYDKILRGKAGIRKIEVNVLGREIRELDKQEWVPGEDLTLTLDARLQKKTYDLVKGLSAAVVVIDVRNGDILAMVSAPAFDPNRFNMGWETKEWNSLMSDEKSPLMNKTIAGAYPPGSTFKMVVGLSALEAGVVNAETIVSCPGYLQVGSHTFYDWNRGGHGKMNLKNALKFSCDVYFYEAARQTGMDRIATMAERFGLGLPTGIDLYGERTGNIPTKYWKEGRHSDVWRQGDTVNAGIGQGYVLATPLQLAVMTARIASGGKKVEPRLLKQTVSSQEDFKQVRFEDMKLPKAHLKVIQSGMNAVVNEKRGTAHALYSEDAAYQMAGKTGTSQVKRISTRDREEGSLQKDVPWKERDHALFVGYAPVKKPVYAVAVLVEHGGGGSRVAGPIAKAVMDEALRLYYQEQAERKGKK